MRRRKMKWIVPDSDGVRFIGGDNNDWVVRTPDGWRIKERLDTIRYPAEIASKGMAPEAVAS